MNVQSPNDPWNLFWSLGYRRLVPIAPPGVQLIPESGIDPAALPALLNLVLLQQDALAAEPEAL